MSKLDRKAYAYGLIAAFAAAILPALVSSAVSAAPMLA